MLQTCATFCVACCSNILMENVAWYVLCFCGIWKIPQKHTSATRPKVIMTWIKWTHSSERKKSVATQNEKITLRAYNSKKPLIKGPSNFLTFYLCIIFFRRFLYYACLFGGIFEARCMMRSLHNIMTSQRGHYTI